MPRRTDRIIRLSQKAIDELVPPAKDRVEWWDEQTPGLGVRVSSSGKKTFVWVGRHGGDFKRVTIGPCHAMSIPRARDEAKRLTAAATTGELPTTKRKALREHWRLQDLFDWYFETFSKPHKRTWQWDERQYNRVLKPWANRRVSTITRSEVQSLHIELGETRGTYAANKMLELLGHMVRMGKLHHPEKVPGENPVDGVKRFPREERERFLDQAEIDRFLAAVDKLHLQKSKDFLMLALLTGARRGNVLSMRWDEISMSSAIWTIPTDKSKSKKPMNIPLSDPAMAILTRRLASSDSEWVFPGGGPTGHYNDPRDAWNQVKAMAKLKDVRLHDLRRTLGSWMAVNSPLQVVGKQLGHSSLKSTAIYARLANKTVKDAANDAANRMLGR